jgi:acetylornithine/succinyldiaminopimelate/putrescine aminotransferase
MKTGVGRRTQFRPVRLSLADLVGESHIDAVIAGRSKLTGERASALRQVAGEKVDFFPPAFQKALAALLPKVGSRLSEGRSHSPAGASTAAFNAAMKAAPAPLTGWGYYRVGEDGRLYFTAKSEHYHASLGHGFPGWRLVENARRLGIPNATHNNTRGAITRLLEEELIRLANGLRRGDRAGLRKVLASRRPGVLNRVLNLETGSLAAEAGLKLMLARFYKVQADSPEPKYAGRIPVFLVIGDEAGGLEANYHGTAIATQVLRGMWPALRGGLEAQGLLKVVPVRPDNLEELQAAFRRYDAGRHKIAGFLHELVLMNYGGRRLGEAFVRRIQALCRSRDVPTLVDEIQSGVWSPQLYLYREYGIRPNIVAIGKGFPGGEYAASRVLFDATMDVLPQFGALVTSGQEELASLTYLVTLRWAEANREVTRAVGDGYQAQLRGLVGRYPQHLAGVEGCRHMASLCFHDLGKAKAFAARLVGGGIDISVQEYKADCPPMALTKLPLIAGHEAVAMLVARMDAALRRLPAPSLGGCGPRPRGRRAGGAASDEVAE